MRETERNSERRGRESSKEDLCIAWDVKRLRERERER